MAARKLANEVERCFKKVEEGVAAFESIHEKIISSTNPSQKEKLEDSLKKEIKKLQRNRDQIKAWAATNDIKDKKPLLEKRKLIETQMEKFKAVEKEMKTKAYSKEGLSAASKMDPKEKEKSDMVNFLSNMVDELERQIETSEAEQEAIQATMKKKKDSAKAERIASLEELAEQHKWHQGKLELLMRALENGGVEAEQVKELEESIRYYVENNQDPDFVEDDSIYDDLNLQDEEDLYGMPNEMDKVSSQDAQSIQDDTADPEPPAKPAGKGKAAAAEPPAAAARRSSTQLKSPLPALATLHTAPTTSAAPPSTMKPAPLPVRTPGEPLKYASAAAAAAASDKNGVGIAPLPPPPGVIGPSNLAPLNSASKPATTSPSSVNSHPATQRAVAQDGVAKSPALSQVSAAAPLSANSSLPATPEVVKAEPRKGGKKSALPAIAQASTDGDTSNAPSEHADPTDDMPTNSENPAPAYNVPPSLQDLMESFERTKVKAETRRRAPNGRDRIDWEALKQSYRTRPLVSDAERPRQYRPQNPYPYTPDHYPQEPLAVFDDPAFYQRADTDVLFYMFYYRQGTYQQYLAAKALKQQSWRFHKQYQTWFQRHEEPKTITDEYEQGTYRFFDYESTWMNRRKQDFRFQYRFLEDEL